MPTVSPLNTVPIQQFIQQVKSADAAKAKELRMPIDQCKNLAFTLGIVMSRLEGDLEELLKLKQETNETVVVQLGSSNSDWQ